MKKKIPGNIKYIYYHVLKKEKSIYSILLIDSGFDWRWWGKHIVHLNSLREFIESYCIKDEK